MFLQYLLCAEFLKFAVSLEEMRQKWLASVQECQRLHSALDKAHKEIADFDRKLRHARRNLEEENCKRRAIEEQRNFLVANTSFISEKDFSFNIRFKIFAFILFFRKNKLLQPGIFCLMTEGKM